MDRSRQLGAFLRSLFPRDWGQLVLLAGCYLLYMAGSMPWWPPFAPLGTAELWAGVNKLQLTAKPSLVYALAWAILAVFWMIGGAGLFIGCWGAARAARRLLLCVILPSIAAMFAAVSAAVVVFDVNQGGLESSIFHVKNVPVLLAILSKEMGVGLHAALLGVALVSLAAWQVARGRTALPAGFPDARATAAGDGGDAIRRFTWAVLVLSTPMAYLAALVGTPLIEKALRAVVGGRVPEFWIVEATNGSWRVLAAVPVALIAVWLMGSERWRESARLLIPRRWRILGLAIALPLLVHWSLKLAFFLGARLGWATHTRDFEFAPAWADYMRPGRWQWDLLRFPAAAIFSELAWRGYALPRFISRLGLHRGIVLLGILWGMMFQTGHWLPVGGDAGRAIALVSSALFGAVISYPLAWLTMRSDSALPAAALVAVNWMLSQMSTAESYPVVGWLASPYLQLALWAVIGIVLWRSFAPKVGTERPHAAPFSGGGSAASG